MYELMLLFIKTVFIIWFKKANCKPKKQKSAHQHISTLSN